MPSLIAAAVAACAGACGTPDATAGLSGRQVTKGHDIADLFFANARMLAFTRQAAEPTEARPQDLWTWGLSEAEPQLGLEGLDWAPPVWWPRLLMGELLQTGTTGRLFYDFATRVGSDLTSFGATAILEERSDTYPVTAVRRDAGAVAVSGLQRGRIGIGRPSDLKNFTLDGSIGSVDFLGSDLVLLFSPSAEADRVAGLYKLTSSTGELMPLLPTTPVAEWEESFESCSPYDRGCALFRVVGCSDSDPPCPGAFKAPCFILFAKQPADNPDVTAAFAYDVSSRGSFRMPGQNPRSFEVSPDQHTVVWMSETDPEASPGELTPRFWDLCTNVEALCPSGGQSQIGWRPGGGGFALLDFNGPLRVGNGDLCGGATSQSVFLAQYSPMGDRMFWIGDDGTSNAGMWLASWDGSAPVQISDGGIFSARFSSDGQRIIMARRSQDTSSLSYLDLSVSPPVEHRLADNYGGFSRGGRRRMLLVDHWNSQDTSGDLVLVDIDSGVRQALGRAVTEFAVSGDVDGDAPVDVAYAVRSRVAAARDGLWLTALPP